MGGRGGGVRHGRCRWHKKLAKKQTGASPQSFSFPYSIVLAAINSLLSIIRGKQSVSILVGSRKSSGKGTMITE